MKMIGRQYTAAVVMISVGTFFQTITHAECFEVDNLNVSDVETLSNTKKINMMKTRIHDHNICNSSEEGGTKCGTIEYLGCTGSKKFFHESAIKMTWFDAWEYCRSIGLHLAAIESRYEQTFIELFLPSLDVLNTETYWTSGTDLGREGQFSWMATGKPLTFGYFRAGEPNNRFGSENCLELIIKPDVIGYFWNDRNCFGKGYVLCQHDIRYPDKLIQADHNNEEHI